jgi:hypothetical protein
LCKGEAVMKSLQRKIVVVLAALLLSAGIGHAAHMYYIGVVTSLFSNQLTMHDKKYLISPKIKVILRVVGSNGAIHEKSGRLSDISTGNKITIKVINGEVTEIEKQVSR